MNLPWTSLSMATRNKRFAHSVKHIYIEINTWVVVYTHRYINDTNDIGNRSLRVFLGCLVTRARATISISFFFFFILLFYVYLYGFYTIEWRLYIGVCVWVWRNEKTKRYRIDWVGEWARVRWEGRKRERHVTGKRNVRAEENGQEGRSLVWLEL